MWIQLLILCSAGVAIRCSSATDGKKIVCYYASWAAERPGLGQFNIEDINPKLCTHLIYAFTGINEDGTIKFIDLPSDIHQNGFRRFNDIKQQNPKLKTLISIGGCYVCPLTFSKVVSNSGTRQTFIESVIALLRKYVFDGVDIDWEYPGARTGAISDKANFATLLEEFRSEFGKGYLLSIATGATPAIIATSYDVPRLSRSVDFINVKTYDFGSWAAVTGNHAPLYIPPSPPTMSVSMCINIWLSSGANASKLVLGIPAYGRSFTLSDINANGIGALALRPGRPGPYSQEYGFLGYNEICWLVTTVNWQVVWNDHQKAPYVYSGTQWVGYDNPQSVNEKTNYIKSKRLGGAMMWSVDTDDFKGSCRDGRYPLLTAINNGLNEV